MKILVVDDEQDVKDLFEQKFRKEIKSKEQEFTFFLNASDALSYLEAMDSETDLILSDINMPGMSGLDLLNKIKNGSFASPPKMVMISAYGDENSKTNASSMGADDFLTKPLDFNILKEKIKNFVA